MAENTDQSVLRRKIGEQSAQAETRGMSPQKAMRLATARAGQGIGELVATLAGCTQSRVALEQITAAVDGPQLVFLMKGMQAAQGLAVIDAAIVSGVVEHLTTGRVASTPPEQRDPSRTDAVMLADFLDRMLAAMDEELAVGTEVSAITGYRSLVVLDDARAVAMALEDVPYRRFDLAIDLAEGAKTGEIWLFFPNPMAASGGDAAQQGRNWQDAWQAHVDRIPARVEAVLHKFAMPLDQLRELEVGSLIPVPVEQVGAVRLTGADRNAVAIGKLGQALGHRAVRINSQVQLQRTRTTAEVTLAIPAGAGGVSGMAGEEMKQTQSEASDELADGEMVSDES